MFVAVDMRPNGITAILADCERREAPAIASHRQAPVRERLLFWLRRRTLSARDVAEKTGIDLPTAQVLLTYMRRDRQVVVVYRRWVEYEIDGPGRRRHLVSYYRARVR